MRLVQIKEEIMEQHDYNKMTLRQELEARFNDIENTKMHPVKQITGAIIDMSKEYLKMKHHKYKFLDDYHHCKANYNASSRGE